MRDEPSTPDPDQTPETPATDTKRHTPDKARRKRRVVGPLVPSEKPESGSHRWSWPVANLVGLVAVIFVSWLANWVPFNGHTTNEVSNAHRVPFQPANWTLLVWSLIFGLLAIFVVYSLIPAGRRNRRVQTVGPFFLAVNIASIAWILCWHWERFTGSLIAIVVLLGSLASIYGILRSRGEPGYERTLVERVLIRGTFSIYLGWIIFATLANVEIWMDNGGWSGDPFGLNGWTIIFLIGSILVTAAFAFLGRDAGVPLVAAWVFAGVAHEQWGGPTFISLLAGVLAAGSLILGVMATLLAFDARRESELPAMSRLRQRFNRSRPGNDPPTVPSR